MTDVDYKIIEHKVSRLKHLQIVNGLKVTVCGLILNDNYEPFEMKMKKFWTSVFSCKNCKRAAKR